MPLTSFQHYLAETNHTLQKKHPNLSIEMLKLIAPKQFIPEKNSTKGILLIHGMLDSCASMHSLYESYSSQGFHINTVLLPGHGSSPDELLNVSYHQWLTCVKHGLDDLTEKCDNITVMALSAGATLALYMAEKYESITQLVLFAPALALLPKMTALIPNLHKFNQLAPLIAKKWLTFTEEDDKAKYKSITTNCVFQLMSLIELVMSPSQKKINCPIFMIVSSDDETVSTQTAIDFLKKQENNKNQLLIYSNQTTYEPLGIMTEVVNSCIPNKKILNYSHICMHVSPEHSLYGEKANQHTHYLGALTKQNNLNYKNKLKRLTYNPNYTALVNKISLFIKKDFDNES